MFTCMCAKCELLGEVAEQKVKTPCLLKSCGVGRKLGGDCGGGVPP